MKNRGMTTFIIHLFDSGVHLAQQGAAANP